MARICVRDQRGARHACPHSNDLEDLGGLELPEGETVTPSPPLVEGVVFGCAPITPPMLSIFQVASAVAGLRMPR